MNTNDLLVLVWVFMLGLLFSAAGWLNKRSRSEDYVEGKTSKQKKIEGSTHTIIGGGLSVLFFSVAQHYFPDWDIIMQGGAGVAIGSLLSEAVIKFAERKLHNV